jgi:hypothetical protein
MGFMYDESIRSAALADLQSGASLRSVSLRTGIARATLRGWVDYPSPKQRVNNCPICTEELFPPSEDYLYVLGVYLGDGCISIAARTAAMRIACADSWPGLKDECERALRSVSAQRKVYRVSSQGCQHLTCLWQHWPCLFPQHGPGKKHERSIVFVDWQEELVAADPRPLIRGLLHSDGCRVTNTIHRNFRSGPRTYEYPRYFFTNVSVDIQRIFCTALDRLGIEWRQNRWCSISVARRDSVAALDEFVGPKS